MAEQSAIDRPLASDESSAAAAFFVFFAGLLVSAALASDPHSPLRNWFQVCPSSVPASFAAWYFALHSAIVSALAGAARNNATTAAPVNVASLSMSIFASIVLLSSTLRVNP